VKLAGRIAVSNLHKKTMKSFSETYDTSFFLSTLGGEFEYPRCDWFYSIHLCMQGKGSVYALRREVWLDGSHDR
jgi:hypothetical protein